MFWVWQEVAVIPVGCRALKRYGFQVSVLMGCQFLLRSASQMCQRCCKCCAWMYSCFSGSSQHRPPRSPCSHPLRPCPVPAPHTLFSPSPSSPPSTPLSPSPPPPFLSPSRPLSHSLSRSCSLTLSFSRSHSLALSLWRLRLRSLSLSLSLSPSLSLSLSLSHSLSLSRSLPPSLPPSLPACLPASLPPALSRSPSLSCIPLLRFLSVHAPTDKVAQSGCVAGHEILTQQVLDKGWLNMLLNNGFCFLVVLRCAGLTDLTSEVFKGPCQCVHNTLCPQSPTNIIAFDVKHK